MGLSLPPFLYVGGSVYNPRSRQIEITPRESAAAAAGGQQGTLSIPDPMKLQWENHALSLSVQVRGITRDYGANKELRVVLFFRNSGRAF